MKKPDQWQSIRRFSTNWNQMLATNTKHHPGWDQMQKKSSHLVDVLREFGKIEVQAFFEIRKGQPERAGWNTATLCHSDSKSHLVAGAKPRSLRVNVSSLCLSSMKPDGMKIACLPQTLAPPTTCNTATLRSWRGSVKGKSSYESFKISFEIIGLILSNFKSWVDRLTNKIDSFLSCRGDSSSNPVSNTIKAIERDFHTEVRHFTKHSKTPGCLSCLLGLIVSEKSLCSNLSAPQHSEILCFHGQDLQRHVVETWLQQFINQKYFENRGRQIKLSAGPASCLLQLSCSTEWKANAYQETLRRCSC